MSSILKVDQLQDSGGNALITSDGSGNLTTQKLLYPAFEVYKTDTQNPSDNVITKVTYNTVRYDTNSFWDATNNRFLPTVAGKYYVYSKLSLNSTGTNNVLTGGVYIYKNGSVYNRSTVSSNSGSAMSGIDVFEGQIVEMNGTSDYVESFGVVDVSGGTPQFLTFSNNYANWFGAYRIGD